MLRIISDRSLTSAAAPARRLFRGWSRRLTRGRAATRPQTGRTPRRTRRTGRRRRGRRRRRLVAAGADEVGGRTGGRKRIRFGAGAPIQFQQHYLLLEWVSCPSALFAGASAVSALGDEPWHEDALRVGALALAFLEAAPDRGAGVCAVERRRRRRLGAPSRWRPEDGGRGTRRRRRRNTEDLHTLARARNKDRPTDGFRYIIIRDQLSAISNQFFFTHFFGETVDVPNADLSRIIQIIQSMYSFIMRSCFIFAVLC